MLSKFPSPIAHRTSQSNLLSMSLIFVGVNKEDSASIGSAGVVFERADDFFSSKRMTPISAGGAP